MENRKIKYTFLLPAYKPNFLEEALLSIKNQTYIDFKVIVSDDCSPYDLKSIFDIVCSDDARFTYCRNDVNMGGKSLVSHWNLLVEMCDTEFFVMASDDDVYEPLFLEQINFLVGLYPDVNLFRGKVREIDETGVEKQEEISIPEYFDSLHFILRMYQPGFIPCEANYVYRTDIVRKNKGYVDFPKAWFSDDATHILMSKKGCCTTSEVVFNFRSSNVSISGNRRDVNECVCKVKASYGFYAWMKQFLAQFDEKDELVGQIKELYKEKVIRNVKDYIFGCPFKTFLKLLCMCPRSLDLYRCRMFVHWFRWRM